jgi:hypothetical protein
MRLTIKDPKVAKLAQSLVQETGESLARAVEIALPERLAHIRRSRKQEAKAEALLRMGRRCASHLRREPTDHAALLYDETGLPR